jgi:hypothetical protein
MTKIIVIKFLTMGLRGLGEGEGRMSIRLEGQD